MAETAAVKEKVRSILMDRLGSVEEDRDGDFTVRHGSARVFVRVAERDAETTLVRIWALVAMEVPLSPALFEFIARRTDTFFFGHLGMFEDESGGATVTFSHNLLGDYLDAPELMHALGGVASSADELDDEVVANFGGRTFH